MTETRQPSLRGSAALRAFLQQFPPLSRTLAASPAPRSAENARRERAIALSYGAICHTLFAIAILSMIAGMWFGMTRGLGVLAMPWGWLGNLALLAQFPVGHSLLLTTAGRKGLGRLGPVGKGGTLATTTYAIIASVQLLMLFALWTPSGVVWWRADGVSLVVFGALYGASWLLLFKAIWDAGAELQSGLLGWVSLLRGVKPQYPPMPQTGLFRLIRQPIYVAFALTTWTVPTWTPDQLVVAVTLTAYCLIGPLFKERRFRDQFSDEWRAYRARTPYWLPLKKRRTS